MTRQLLLALAVVLAVAGCEQRTYVLVTVEVDPSISGDIAELRFVSRLLVGTEVIDTDEQRFGGSGSTVSLPDSFIILADDRGKDGEELEIYVEAFDSSGAAIARGRGGTYIVSRKESTTQIVLRGVCVEVDDCLAGRAFCDAPQSCACEGEACLEGFCAPLPLDDGNSCTESVCDEQTRVVTQTLAADGQSCAADDGTTQTCAQGVCKAPACGDFIVDLGEECDEGLLNSDTEPLACRSDCTAPRCGDGVLDDGIAFGRVFDEECDDPEGNSNVDPDACREIELDGAIACRVAFCGDGVVDVAERCDDANKDGGDGCNPTCNLHGEVSLLAGGAGGRGNADGTGDDARLRDLFDLAVEGDLAYFTADERHGSIVEDHTIRRLDVATGTVTTIAGETGVSGASDGVGAAAHFWRPRGLSLAGDSLFVADSANNAVRVVDLATGAVTTVAGAAAAGHVDGAVASARFAQPRFVAAVSPTEVLVLDTQPSVGCRLRRVDLAAGQVETVAGSSICFPFDGSGTSAFFGTVTGMVLGPDSYLYVADSSTIRRVNLSVEPAVVTTLAGAANSEGHVDGTGTAARFHALGGIALGDGVVYVADLGNSALRSLDLATSEVTTLSLDDALVEPRAIGLAGDRLLVAEWPSHTLLEVALGGPPPLSVATVAGRAEQPGHVEGTGSAARFDEPAGVTTVQGAAFAGKLFVADAMNGALRLIDLVDGAVTTLREASSGATVLASAIASDDGRLFGLFSEGGQPVLREIDPATGDAIALPGAPIEIDTPSAHGVAVLGDYAYVAAIAEGVIRRVHLTTGAEEIFAGDSNILGVADGPRSLALFGAPTGLVACGGDLYVAEGEDTFRAHVIRKIDFSTTPEMVTTLAGVPGVPGWRDGDGTTALFYSPAGLTCDDDSLYVAEAGNHLVRQIELDTGRVTTLAGAARIAGAIDGTGTEARFSAPQGITYDPATGDLFVTDRDENVVRRIR